MPLIASLTRARFGLLTGSALFLLSCGSGDAAMMAKEPSVVRAGPSLRLDWTQQLGSSSFADAHWGLASDHHGGVMVLGQTTTEPPFVRRYDATGSVLWSVTDTDHPGTIASDGEGNNFVAGVTTGVVLTKRDLDGGLVWTRPFGPATAERVIYQGVDDSAHVSVVWNKVPLPRNPEPVPFQVTRTDSAGADAGTVPGPAVYLVTMDAGGNLFFVEGAGVYTLTKQDPTGVTLWTRSVTGFVASCATTDRNGNVLLAGLAGARDAQLTKLDPDGNLVWSQVFAADGLASPHAVAADAHGNITVVGEARDSLFRQNSVLYSDAFIVQYGPDGESIATLQFGEDLEDDEADQVAVDDSGAVYVAGRTAMILSQPDSDVFLKRFVH